MGGINYGYLAFAPKSWNKKAKRFFEGTPEENYQQSLLNPGQQKLHEQGLGALQQPGQEGAFGNIADYYRDLLSNDSQTMNQLSAPEMRQFNEQTIPDLAHQFAGMGAGNLSSSSFRNAAVGAGTDLSERLGALRANLRQQGAQGFQNLAQGMLNPVVENIHRPATPGFLQQAAPAVAQAATAYFTGGMPMPSVGGQQQQMQGPISSKGQSFSPQGYQSNYQLPNRGF